MAKIAANKRIAVETLRKMDDDTKNNLVLPLNQLNEQMVNALDGKLSINDNTNSHIVSHKLPQGKMVVIANPLDDKPIGIIPIDSDGALVQSLKLTILADSRQVGVTASYLAPDSFTDWSSYTPTITGLPTSTNNGRFRRVGDTLEIQTYAVASGAGTGNILLSIPAGLTIDFAKLSRPDSPYVGVANASGVTNDYVGNVFVNGTSNSLKISGTAQPQWNATIPFTWANANHLDIKASMPIVGWSVESSSTATVRFMLVGG